MPLFLRDEWHVQTPLEEAYQAAWPYASADQAAILTRSNVRKKRIHRSASASAPLPISRWASWFVGLAALLLIAASLGSYLYHRRQLESIAAQHLRLAIVGPGELRAGIPTSFNLLATRVTGEPWPTSIAWSLSKLDGIHVDHKERTDEQGRLVMTVPAGMALPNHASATAQLDVTAGEHQ